MRMLLSSVYVFFLLHFKFIAIIDCTAAIKSLLRDLQCPPYARLKQLLIFQDTIRFYQYQIRSFKSQMRLYQ